MLKVLLFNDINIEVKVNSLFKDFRGNSTIFLFSFSLYYSCKFNFDLINNVSDLLFLSIVYVRLAYYSQFSKFLNFLHFDSLSSNSVIIAVVNYRANKVPISIMLLYSMLTNLITYKIVVIMIQKYINL